MVAFTNDDFRVKPASRSDYYTRINEGKLALTLDGDNTTLHCRDAVNAFRFSTFSCILAKY